MPPPVIFSHVLKKRQQVKQSRLNGPTQPTPSAALIPPCENISTLAGDKRSKLTCAATVWLLVGKSLVMHAVLKPASASPKAALRPAPPAPLVCTTSTRERKRCPCKTHTTTASYSCSIRGYFPEDQD
jgi:hypothetical protein